MELDEIKVKLDTKRCANCSHHHDDHFTDSLKYPKSRKCVLGCGMPLCCYGGCKCDEYSAKIISVPYHPRVEPKGQHEYIQFDHCQWCHDIDSAERAMGCDKEPNYYLGEEFLRGCSAHTDKCNLRHKEIDQSVQLVLY